MNINHLRYFVDAARLEGLSNAAKKNFVTQSAISRAITNLEQELDVELILHKQNTFQLTEAGQAILAQSSDVFISIQRLTILANDYSKGLRGPLRMGCNETIASKLIAPLMSKISETYPNVKPTLHLGNTDTIQRLIDENEIDFGIVMDDGEVEKSYQTRQIFKDYFVLVSAPNYFNKSIEDNLIVSRTKPGGMSDRYIREYKKCYKKNIVPKLVVTSWQVVMDLAIRRCGYALVPLFVCQSEIDQKRLTVVQNKIKPLPFNLCAIYAKNRHLPKNATAVLEFIEKH
ncbi:MAG: LysR family transcriptional regulator [Proteobacteria bacterium]|nr:LysR family transcriptional regulator [Pseudomonadota bacterium]